MAALAGHVASQHVSGLAWLPAQRRVRRTWRSSDPQGGPGPLIETTAEENADQLSLKLTVTVMRTGTGWPLRSVGV